MPWQIEPLLFVCLICFSRSRHIILLLRTPPRRGSETLIQFLGVLLTHRLVRVVPRAKPNFFQLLVIPFLAHHPVHPNRQSARIATLGDLPPRRIFRWWPWIFLCKKGKPAPREVLRKTPSKELLLRIPSSRCDGPSLFDFWKLNVPGNRSWIRFYVAV